MTRGIFIVAVALLTCVLLIVCFRTRPPRTPWSPNGDPQMLQSNPKHQIEKMSFREEIVDIDTNRHNKHLPFPLVSWPTLLDMLKDDFTKCQRTAPFVDEFDYLKTFKNPCWSENTKNGNVSCLPYFYLAGFSKSGTTDVSQRIKKHPQIFFANKELHWFDVMRYTRYFASIKDYAHMFKTFSGMLQNNSLSQSRTVTGDMTPSYAFSSLYWRCFEGNERLPEPKYVIPDVIHRITPKAKVILIMRDPVQRLFSRYLTWFKRVPGDPAYMDPSAQRFHDKCEEAIQAYQDCFKKHSVRFCAYDGNLYGQVKLRLQESMYSVFVKDWLRVFPREQILFLKFEEYVNDIPGSLDNIFKFLDLDPLTKKKMQVLVNRHAGNRGSHYHQVKDMLNSTRKMLNDFYRPFVNDLQTLIGEKFCWEGH